MTVATTPHFKPPGVTSCVAHLIKFIKIDKRASKHDLKDAKLSRQSQSAPLEKK